MTDIARDPIGKISGSEPDHPGSSPGGLAKPASQQGRVTTLVGGPCDGVEFTDARLPGRWFVPHPWSGKHNGSDRSDVLGAEHEAWHSYGLAANTTSRATYRYEGWMCP